jgi:hypothetical protein
VPGPLVNLIWFIGILCEAAVVVCAIKKGAFRRYFVLNLYMAGLVFVELGRYKIVSEYGLASVQYRYFYFYSDTILTIFLYFALTTLYAHVFSEMKAERYVKMGALVLLVGTAAFTGAVVLQSSTKLLTRFVVDLSQNLYFVGLVLTYVLWGAILKLRETRTRLIQLVLSLGVYFSLFAANYAIRNLYPPLSSVFVPLIQIFGLFLPLAWAYAFWRLPEEARLAPSRLAVIPR